MRTLVLALLVIAPLGGCAAFRGVQTKDTEELLATTGFRAELAESPAQLADLHAVPPLKMTTHSVDGIVVGHRRDHLGRRTGAARAIGMGRFLHRNYSGYLVPTNADIPELETLFVGEFDEEASPLGAKGLGELTAVSVAPAIANAVYHATGKRVRDLPITVEKLL